MTSYIAKDDSLYAFRCNKYGLIDFIINRSISQWIVPAMYKELLEYELTNSGESPTRQHHEEQEAYHNIVEVLSILYDEHASKKYFVPRFIPDTEGTERTFYGAATLITHDEKGNDTQNLDGYIEIGCDADLKCSTKYMLWHLRFQPKNERDDLGFSRDFLLLEGDNEYLPEFYRLFGIEGRDMTCKVCVNRVGTAIFTYFKPRGKDSPMIPVKRLMLYPKNALEDGKLLDHAIKASSAYANKLKEAFRNRS